MSKAVGVWGISNNTAVKLLDIEYGIVDVAIVQYQDEEPESYDIRCGADGSNYIMYGEIVLSFDECVRL